MGKATITQNLGDALYEVQFEDGEIDKIWCADYTPDIEVGTVVGTIEIQRRTDNNARVIKPSKCGGGNIYHNVFADGEVKQAEDTSAINVFLALALEDGAKAWRPLYCLASVLSTTEDAVRVASGGIGNQSFNAWLPVEYMTKNAEAIGIADAVIVKMENGIPLKVIGFLSNPAEDELNTDDETCGTPCQGDEECECLTDPYGEKCDAYCEQNPDSQACKCRDSLEKTDCSALACKYTGSTLINIYCSNSTGLNSGILSDEAILELKKNNLYMEQDDCCQCYTLPLKNPNKCKENCENNEVSTDCGLYCEENPDDSICKGSPPLLCTPLGYQRPNKSSVMYDVELVQGYISYIKYSSKYGFSMETYREYYLYRYSRHVYSPAQYPNCGGKGGERFSPPYQGSNASVFQSTNTGLYNGFTSSSVLFLSSNKLNKTNYSWQINETHLNGYVKKANLYFRVYASPSGVYDVIIKDSFINNNSSFWRNNNLSPIFEATGNGLYITIRIYVFFNDTYIHPDNFNDEHLRSLEENSLVNINNSIKLLIAMYENISGSAHIYYRYGGLPIPTWGGLFNPPVSIDIDTQHRIESWFNGSSYFQANGGYNIKKQLGYDYNKNEYYRTSHPFITINKTIYTSDDELEICILEDIIEIALNFAGTLSGNFNKIQKLTDGCE